MTYPPSSSGYPPSQQPTTQFSAPTQQFGKVEQQQHQQGSVQTPAAITPSGPSRLPFILLTAVAVLGLLVYLFSFGDVFTIESSDFPQMGSASGTSQGVVMAVVAALVSGLIAAASLLPRQKAPIGVIAAVAVLSFLLVLAEIIQKPEGVSIGWALYVVVLLTLLQSAVAIGALLLDSGIIKAPVPKPKHEQQPNYGPYGQPNQYYGQHAAPQGQGQGPGQQRPPYPGQYSGGYSGAGSSTGGFSAIGQHGGPPTPPTGFPTYSQPQSSQSGQSGQPAQQQPPSSSNQSGNSTS
ncbi:DUF5336 domain-containing protein [Mycobacterium sp. ITM-2016-00318]|uniref:DUF5336 domain-containing protein n=1 Tax=Mycobacterium sp. ITM-2016-00318 TaxID=2099693 RepID=UPI000CF89938|nr:DUF5336 domain-containing protein [Mycobacterium sp. ITM-2016-00318]WNG92037.1 DUF5336 domain-containing protein [Mycobacterium sp. ITM-2016-00318]